MTAVAKRITKRITAQSVKVRRDQAGEKARARAFMALCEQRGLPKPTPEYAFAAPRKWRFDFSYPTERVALEVEGGFWTGGAHARGKHARSDMEKYNTAALNGWRVLRTTPEQLCTAETIALLSLALNHPTVTP